MDRKDQNVCWASLMEEVLVQIFSKLDFHSLVSVSGVCHSWSRASQDPECWDRVHLSRLERFLDCSIKESGFPPNQESLSKESDCVIRHAGARAKSIFVRPTADDIMLHMIADRCPSIESISLRECNHISPNALLKLFRTCKNLKLVDAKFCSAVCAPVIKEMGQSCRGLIGLNLGGHQVTEEMANAVGKFMPKLKWLSLNSATIFSATLCSILDSCTDLEHVSVQWSRGLLMCDELKSRSGRIADFKYSPHDPADPSIVGFYHGYDLGYP